MWQAHVVLCPATYVLNLFDLHACDGDPTLSVYYEWALIQ